ncbi:Protein of unknown function DUF2059 [Pseudodesulfovibrio mercurii]|uniref:DUF2059 domain-containing protein n=1 Tax=Pseudodesulfovibrio mercurii TaxID=641491 RepID=F0JGN5_9BACT|nr:hypothetical protein [Pseudodesulfovibrio mercurii]EGB13904.1 Protein of unknown function DUF2059 [Pseudodesulfovibrio mercurii]
MKRLLIFPLLLLTLALCASPALAERPTDQSLMTMFEASGTVDTVQTMMAKLLAVAQIQLKKKLPNLPEEAGQIINEEMHNAVQKTMNDVLAKQTAYYAERLTQQDVDDLIALYDTPVWKKQFEVTQQYAREEYGKMLREDIPKMTNDMMARIATRLKEAGYIKDK